MTDWLDVSSTTPRIAYVATSGQTSFTVPFVFEDQTHLQVYQNDGLLTLTTHYTVFGEEDENGGSIALVTGATVGDSIIILRDIDYELTTHIPTSGPLDVAAINMQFTLFVMMLQQAVAAFPRSIRQPDSDVDDMDELGTAATRASKYLFFDADGQPTTVASVSTSVAALAFWVTLLSTTNSAATARSGLGIADTSASIGAFNHLNFR